MRQACIMVYIGNAIVAAWSLEVTIQRKYKSIMPCINKRKHRCKAIEARKQKLSTCFTTKLMKMKARQTKADSSIISQGSLLRVTWILEFRHPAYRNSLNINLI
jgi:uncharacterized membrane protein